MDVPRGWCERWCNDPMQPIANAAIRGHSLPHYSTTAVRMSDRCVLLGFAFGAH